MNYYNNRQILTKTNNKLVELLENILNPNDEEPMFNKVLLGYDLTNTFNYNRPVAFCYVQGVTEYYKSFNGQNKIRKFESVFGFVVKGITTERYRETIEIADFLHDKLENDEEFLTIKGVVDTTAIKESSVNIIENKNTLSTAYSFILEHEILY